MNENKEPLRVLIAEDNPNDAELILRELRRAGYDPEWERVDTEAQYVAQLNPKLDIILSDFEMPGFGGLRALELLQNSRLAIPFIIISGTIGEDMAVSVMRQGATDYLLKDRLTRLGEAVRRAVQEVRERSRLRLVEAQFVEAQKMEVVGQLAAGVAHDFNNILAVIMGYSDLIATELGEESPLRKFTDEIGHASDRAAGLTRQLLVFSRKQTIQPVVLDLDLVLQELEKMLRRLSDENIQMTIVPGHATGRIKADSGYVGQVVMNLVVNARDAMPNGGKLTIATNNVSLPGDDKGVAAGDYVMLSVTDTGTGMSDEVKAHLFEAFFTTKPKGKGTGLGLATCHTVMQQSGGHIAVSSQLGQGTTFKIYFPRVEQPLAATVAVETMPGAASTRGTETLLVVEDEPTVRHLAEWILQAQGYEVLTASNGQDGLHVAREHHGAPISLVVTDVVMPLMSGKVMAEWLKTTYPDLKILFTSGYTDEAIAQHGVFESGVEFLPKPYTPTLLVRKVREMLDSPIEGT